jgi:PAS domain S-box-containing protein
MGKEHENRQERPGQSNGECCPERVEGFEQAPPAEALRDVEERCRVTSSLISDYTYGCRVGPDGELGGIWAVGDLLRITGYTLDELEQGRRWQDVIHPDDLPIMMGQLGEVLKGESPMVEYRIIRKDGEIRWMRGHVRPVLDEQTGRVVRIYGAVQDISGSRQTEAALRENEERYRILSSLISDFAYGFRVGSNGELSREWVTGAVTEMTGYTEEEFVAGGGWSAAADPADAEVVKQQLAEILDGKAAVVDFRLRRKDGSTRWVRDYARPVKDEGTGRVARIYGAVQDISDRRQTETALRESEERYRVVSSLISDFAYGLLVGPGGELSCEWVTGAVEEMTGLTESEFLAHDGWSPETHDEDSRLAREQLETLLKGEAAVVDVRTVHKDGTTKWVRDYARPVMDEQTGRVVRIYGAVQDISNRKEAEDVQSVLLNVSQAVSESGNLEELLATIHHELGRLIDTTNFYVALYHEETGTYTFPYHVDQFDANEQIQPATLEKSLTDYVRRLGRAQMIDEPAFQGLVDSGEVELIGAPSAIWLGVPLKAAGKVIGVVVVQSYQESSPYSESDFQVMTFVSGNIAIAIERKLAEEERERLEAQVRHAQKLESLGVLAGGIAHDFNNLLTGVLGNIELGLLQVEEGSSAARSFTEARVSAERAADLSRQMLAYSGKGNFVIEAVDVNALVSEIGNLLEVSVSKNVALSYDLHGGLPPVVADVTQLHQVLLNLITNASDSIGDEGGVVTLRTGIRDCDSAYLSETYLDDHLAEGDYLFIEVSDTGCGMDPETMQRIFDPFFSTKFTGRGLGLASALGIVRGHSGAIKVASGEGKGTTFTVLLPVGNCVCLVQPEKRVEVTSSDGGGTVLLVDDEDAVRDIGMRLLEQAGFDVVGAADGCEAIDYYREHSDEVSCVLLDLTMPRMGGEETFQELRKIRDDVRVVLSSGFSEQEVVGRFAEGGICGFVQKPYRFEKLVAEVEAAARAGARDAQ